MCGYIMLLSMHRVGFCMKVKFQIRTTTDHISPPPPPPPPPTPCSVCVAWGNRSACSSKKGGGGGGGGGSFSPKVGMYHINSAPQWGILVKVPNLHVLHTGLGNNMILSLLCGFTVHQTFSMLASANNITIEP